MYIFLHIHDQTTDKHIIKKVVIFVLFFEELSILSCNALYMLSEAPLDGM